MDQEMRARVKLAAHATWSAIGGDIFDALAEEGIDEMPRSHVIEVVADAGHMEMYGRDKEAVTAFRSLDRKAAENILLETFPFISYGM